METIKIKRISCKTEEEVLEVLRKLEKDGYTWNSTFEKPTKWLPRAPVFIGVWDDNTITFTRSESSLDFNVSAKEFINEGEKMQTQYVIEIEKISASSIDEMNSFYKIKGTNVMFHASDLNNFPTANDMRNDAYEKGKNEQFVKDSETIKTLTAEKEELSRLLDGSKSEAEKLQDKTWETAKKVWSLNPEEKEKAFGEMSFFKVLEMPYSVVLAKLKAYEECKEANKITEGDVVEYTWLDETSKFIVLVIKDDFCGGLSLDADREVTDGWNYSKIRDVRQTGEHYNISNLLNAMKGDAK